MKAYNKNRLEYKKCDQAKMEQWITFIFTFLFILKLLDLLLLLK